MKNPEKNYVKLTTLFRLVAELQALGLDTVPIEDFAVSAVIIEERDCFTKEMKDALNGMLNPKN